MPYNAAGQWVGGGGGGSLAAEDAVKTGLGGAAGLIGSQAGINYPAYVPSQTRAPSTGNYPGYSPNQPMAQITAPNYKLNNINVPQYQGLMGGDYNALQSALQVPGEIAARQAYNQGQVNLTNQMGGRGLYGSSIMSNQARNALEQPYMDALASNAAQAASTRYGMQATGLQNQNMFGTDIYGKQLAQEQNQNVFGMDAAQLMATQNQNVYQAGVGDAARQQDYNVNSLQYQNAAAEQMRAWQNAQDLEKMQYQLASGEYGNQQNTQAINQYLALAGLGAPLAQANQQAGTASNAGWMTLAGQGLNALGGLLSS